MLLCFKHIPKIFGCRLDYISEQLIKRHSFEFG